MASGSLGSALNSQVTTAAFLEQPQKKSLQNLSIGIFSDADLFKMFQRLKQKVSLARVSDNTTNRDNEVLQQKPHPLRTVADRPMPIYEVPPIQSFPELSITPRAEVEELRNELNRMIRMKQDTLERLRRADALRVEASNRVQLQVQELESKSREIRRLQVELQRKDDTDRLEKHNILQDARAQLTQKDVMLAEQKERFSQQLSEVNRRRFEEAQDMQNHLQALGEENRSMRERLHAEMEERNRLLEDTTLELNRQKQANAEFSDRQSHFRDPKWQKPLRREMEEKSKTLKNTNLELGRLRQRNRELETVLARLRSDNRELQQGQCGIQAEMEEKTRALEGLRTEVEGKADALEERTLMFNRTRNELSEEKRKACQALEDNAEKNRQLEFLQQQCARLQESLSAKGMPPVSEGCSLPWRPSR